MSNIFDKTLILNKIKSYYGFKTNTEFAEYLGVAVTTISSWYSRNTFDIELLVAKCVEIDANWILSGKGNMIKGYSQPTMVNESEVKYSKKEDTSEIQVYKQLILDQTEKIDSLNREIGKLQLQIEQLKDSNK